MYVFWGVDYESEIGFTWSASETCFFFTDLQLFNFHLLRKAIFLFFLLNISTLNPKSDRKFDVPILYT